MKRERNFEAMRTIAMFLIVIYHCLTHGVGVKYSFSPFHSTSFVNLLFSDFLLVISSIAVNLYVLVSGYFLVDLNFKPSRIMRTWLVTCFYSFMITMLLMSFSVIPFNMVNLGKSLFPMSTDAYWFVTQYIGLLLLSPFLSLLVKQLSYKSYIALLLVGAFLCLSLSVDFPLGKRFHVAHGNSLWSFSYLFIVAGFIKYHLKRIEMKTIWIAVTLVVIVTLGVELWCGCQGSGFVLFWLNYNSLPFVLSLLVFVLFKQIQIPQSFVWNMAIRFAPYVFGVYLIHDHLFIREWFWDRIDVICHCEHWIFPLVIIGTCLLIFLGCSFVEFGRKKLFSLLRIDKWMVMLDNHKAFQVTQND